MAAVLSVAGHINPQTSRRPVLTVSLERMNRLLDLDRESLVATPAPGAGPQVESQLRALGYTLGHFPQSRELSTLGGWVASRPVAAAVAALRADRTTFAGGTLETFAGPLETLPSRHPRRDRTCANWCWALRDASGSFPRYEGAGPLLAEDERFYSVFPANWQQALQATPRAGPGARCRCRC